MAGIDRSKFKSTSVAAVQQQEKEVSSMTGRAKGDRAGYLKIKPGKNMFRVFPAHPDGGGLSFIEPKSTVWLPMMMDQRDEQGKVINGADGKPLKKEGSKTVFNSRIHGNTEKDLVEEYFRTADEWAKKHKFSDDKKEDTDLRKKFTDKIWGNFKANIQGIRYSHNWVFYAIDLIDPKHPFGLVEIKPSVKEGINKVVNIEASNQPVGTEATDPFTPIEDDDDKPAGRALVIYYNDKADKPADYYSTSIDTATEAMEIGGRKVQVQKTYPLSDEDLEMLMGYPSLYKTFRNSFKKRDFILQMEGLEFFDKKNNMGIFNSPEFQAALEEIAEYYPEDVETPTEEELNQSEEEQASEQEAEITQEVADENLDQFSLMSRDELKAFAQTNKTGILVKPSMDDNQLRERLREWVEAMAENVVEETVIENAVETTQEVKQEPKTEAQPATTTGGGLSSREKLALMKEKQKQK